MTEATNPATNLPALLPAAERAALALNSTQTERDLLALVGASADIVEVKDDNGRDQAHRIAMTLRTARTTIEKTGKAARDDATKFSKAVIAEQDRLVSIITPEETRVLALRDAWDQEQERIQAEKIAAERRRTEAHEGGIAAIMRMPLDVAGKSAADILAVRDYVAASVAGDEWEEYRERAEAAYAETLAQLEALYSTKLAAEEAAAAEAAVREADRQRLVAEQAEIARVRAEQEAAAARIAAQEAALHRAQLEAAHAAAAAKAKAEAAAAAQAAEMKRQMDELAAARAEVEAERNRIAAAQRAAEELAKDHAEALDLHARFYAVELPSGQRYSGSTFKDNGEPILLTAEGKRSVFCDLTDDTEESPIATQEEAEAIYENAIATEEAQAPAEMLDLPEAEPSDAEILAVYLEAFGGDEVQARERLARFGKEAA